MRGDFMVEYVGGMVLIFISCVVMIFMKKVFYVNENFTVDDYLRLYFKAFFMVIGCVFLFGFIYSSVLAFIKLGVS